MSTEKAQSHLALANMKLLSLICLGLMAMASATPMVDLDNRVITMDLKDRQMFILKLLNNVLQPCMYKDIEEMARTWKIEDNVDKYMKTDVVKKFINLIKVGVLPRGEVFTLHIDRQMEEVVTMFHILYYAKDFVTFIKTACWMRMYLNEGMFVYALTVAVRHRDDCKGIVLPPPYEIYPFYFVRSDVIQKAYLLKMKKGLLDHKLCDFYGIKKTDKDVYVIDENVYDKRVYMNVEDKLRYFTEDIDLNTYYYYFHVDYPFWMKSEIMEKTTMRRWELTLYMYQQMLARYYLERLSNDLGDIKPLSWNRKIKNGYWPWLKLHNGVELPVRSNDQIIVKDYNVNVMRLVEDYEVIIREAILKGHIEIHGLRLELTKTDDIEVLGKLIYGKIDNKKDIDMDKDKVKIEAYRYLLIIMKAVLGLNTLNCDKYFVVPSVLDHYQTALRDPVFWQLQKRLIDYVILFKIRLPSYTREDLHFPGVKIDTIVVDKLVTYFDDYLMDMTNAVTFTDEELKKTVTDMTFLVRKRRLNHQPFKVVLDILSDKAVDCVVRIFLGPKYDNLGQLIDLNKNRLNFVEIDSFIRKLDTGKNTIVRNSVEMHNVVRDRMFTRDWWKKLDGLTDVRELLKKDLVKYTTGFPIRLLLPKGKVGGMKMMLYAIVTPLRIMDNVDMTKLDLTGKDMCDNCRFTIIDKMPLGFPLDRHIDVAKFFTPNMKFIDVTIFHKKMVCDMKTRWERYVLKNYNLLDRTMMMESGTYFTDTEVDTTFTDKKRFMEDLDL